MLNCLGCDYSTCSELLRQLIFSHWCQDVVFKNVAQNSSGFLTLLPHIILLWFLSPEIPLKELFSEYFTFNWILFEKVLASSWVVFCLVTCLLCFFSSFGESKSLSAIKKSQLIVFWTPDLFPLFSIALTTVCLRFQVLRHLFLSNVILWYCHLVWMNRLQET